MNDVSFDNEFLFGASVASYQIDGDGGNTTQWTEWSVKNAEKLAKKDFRRFSKVPGHAHHYSAQARNPSNYVCGDGIKHRENYKEDLSLLKSLGLNAFRFSIEWARIELKQGEFDQEEINFLHDYIHEIKVNGMTPIITLWHWTMPVWFTDIGGFEKAKNIKYFVRFAKKVLLELSEEFEWLITLNEPTVYAVMGYLCGEWPPAVINPIKTVRVMNNLAKSHKQIYDLAKSIRPDIRVSIAHNSATFIAESSDIFTRKYVNFRQFTRDEYFLDKIIEELDFLGVNWYDSERYDELKLISGVNVNNLGWQMRPSDIFFSLQRLYEKYKLPILVTENGLADGKDKYREWWLNETFVALDGAQKSGVALLGYCHWSAFDNFEWDKGFWPRFGLIAVNHQTGARQIRQSAYYYADIIKRAHFKSQ